MILNKKDLCVHIAGRALLLEDFSYTIQHRPTKSMLHIDVLSGNSLSMVMLVQEDKDGLLVRKKSKDEGRRYVATTTGIPLANE